MQKEPVAIAIVEDNPDLRDGLAELVKGAPDCSLSGAYGSVEDFLAAIEKIRPSLVLMDIGLPGLSGIEGLKALKAMRPEVDVLMLTVFEDESKIFDAVCAGASGYLLKKTPSAKILEAIREIREGGAPMTAKVAMKVLTLFRSSPPERKPDFQLTERELEVLGCLVMGSSYKMIADQCSISLDTVRSHIRHIYEKLHVNSKAQAIEKARKNKLT
jgi:two-component system, NarL family, nitrate/nitrite response regulator NarL